ncbi:hypothetical protein [Bradyrhizobium sp. CSA112]|uniref:hypothetical protein n=1 Tax=Bradyrhizobium sp. CSA112 TaxID=2699170 RepID=UPI00319D894B
MSEADLNAAELPLFHPAAHYNSPDDVLNDPELSDPEKRVILSSWASDMFAVDPCPGLRDIPGMNHALRLADILAALRQLDGDDDLPREEISGDGSDRARQPTRRGFHHAGTFHSSHSSYRLAQPGSRMVGGFLAGRAAERFTARHILIRAVIPR